MKQQDCTRRLISLLMMLSVLGLAGCSQESDLTLYNNQSWEFISGFTYDPDDIPEVPLDSPLIQEILGADGISSLMPDTIGDTGLEMLADTYRKEGYRVETNQEQVMGGDTRHTMTITGRGWDRLATMLSGPLLEEFGLPAADVTVAETADGAVHFVVALPINTFGLGSTLPIEFRLHGGRVLDTNAQQVRGGTATWFGINSLMEATVEPQSPTNLTLIIGIAVGAIALLGGGFLLFALLGNRSRRPARSPAGRRIPRQRGNPRRPYP